MKPIKITFLRWVVCCLCLLLSVSAASLSHAQISGAWQSQDVGAVGTAGSSTLNSATGIYTVAGAGADIWDNADAFRFVSKTLSGDGEIIARITSQQNTNRWAKAGLMFRENTSAGSRHVSLFMTPSSGVLFSHRADADGASATVLSTPATSVPIWLKLSRVGNSFFAFCSTDGIYWTLQAQDTVAMPANLSVGLAVCSINLTKTSSATFENLTARVKVDSQAPTAPTNLSATATTDTYVDLSWNASSDDFVVTGYEIYRAGVKVGSSVASHFTDTGLSPLTAYSYTVKAVDSSAQLSAASAALSVTTKANSLPAPWGHRDLGTANNVNVGGTASLDASSGLFRVNGAGKDFWGVEDSGHFAYRTMTGDGWIIARLNSQTNVNAWAKAGLMLRETLNANSKHTSVFLTPGNGLNFMRRASTGGGSTSTSLGEAAGPIWLKVGRAGSTFSAYKSSDGVNWTFLGSQTMTVTSTIYAGLAVTSHTNTYPGYAAFDNVSLVPALADAQAPTAPTNLTRKAVSDVSLTPGWNASTDDVAVSYYRVYRNGALIGTTSATTFTDTTVISGTSYTYGVQAVDGSGKVSATTTAVLGPTLTPMLPAPWQHKDLGSVGLAGDASMSASTLRIDSTGQDIWYESDSGHFVYQPLYGDGSIVTRVASLEQVDLWSKAGVEIRSSLADNAAHAMAVITPGNGVSFQRRLVDGDSSLATTAAGPAAPYWLKLMRQGSVVSAFYSANGVNWTLVDSQTISLPTNAYIGFVVTSKNNASFCLATFDSISVTGSAPNQAPTVNLTAPVAGASYYAPGSITLQASASDADGAVTKVEFYQGDNVKIGESTAAPFSFTWTNVPAGTYTLKAKATDNLGAMSALTAGVNVTVGANPDGDGNGLPDAWETTNFGHAGIDSAADPDGDGLTNLQEYQQNSNPNDFFNGHAPALNASAISASQANLFWSLDGVNFGGLQGWSLERKAAGEPTEAYAEIAGIAGGSVSAFIDKEWMAEAGYTYRLRAYKPGAAGGSGGGYSLYSNEASVAAAPQGTAILPLPLDNLLLWLKADAGVRADAATGAVTSWSDASGHGLNASASASANRPVRVNSAFGAQPAIRFDGANSYLSLPPGFDDFDAGLTVLIVAKPAGAPSYYQRFFDFGNGPAVNNLILCRSDFTANLLYISMGADGQWMTSLNAGGAIVQDSVQLLEATHGAAGAGVSIHKNGALITQGTAAAIPHVTRASNFIGHSNWPGDPLFSGDIAEVLIFKRALSAVERGQFEDYLSAKYNLGMALADADHDGMPDAWEMANGLDPNDPADAALDSDGDGLTNLQERQKGGNPLAYSTAGDGVSDGWKAAQNIADLKTVVSTAKDGIPDSWKILPQNNYNVQANVANQDDDGDGLTNLQEFLLGTNPHNKDTDGDTLPDGSDPNPTIYNPATPSQLSIVCPDEERYSRQEIGLADINYTKVDLSWIVSKSDHITGYLIERKASTGKWTKWQENAPGDATVFSDSGLKANQNYYYRVTAFNKTNTGTAYSNVSETAAHQIPFVVGLDAKLSRGHWTNPGVRQFSYDAATATAPPKHYLHREYKTDGAVSVSGKEYPNDGYDTTCTLELNEVFDYKPKQRGASVSVTHKETTSYPDYTTHKFGNGYTLTTESWQRRPPPPPPADPNNPPALPLHNILDEGFTYTEEDLEWDALNKSFQTTFSAAGEQHALFTGFPPTLEKKWKEPNGYGADLPPYVLDYTGSILRFTDLYGTHDLAQTGNGAFPTGSSVSYSPDWAGKLTDWSGHEWDESYIGGPPSPIDGDGRAFAPLTKDAVGAVPGSYELLISASETVCAYHRPKLIGKFFTLTDTLSGLYPVADFILDSAEDMAYPDDFTRYSGSLNIYNTCYGYGPYSDFDGAETGNVNKWCWVGDRYLDKLEEDLTIHRLKYKVVTTPTDSCKLTWYEVFVPKEYTDATTDTSKFPKVIGSHTVTLPLSNGAEALEGEIDPAKRVDEDGNFLDGDGDYYVVFAPEFQTSSDYYLGLDPAERRDEGIKLEPVQVTPPAPAEGAPAPAAHLYYQGEFDLRLAGVARAVYTFSWEDPAVTVYVEGIYNPETNSYETRELHNGDTLTEEQLAGARLYFRMDSQTMTNISAVIHVSAKDYFGNLLSGGENANGTGLRQMSAGDEPGDSTASNGPPLMGVANPPVEMIWEAIDGYNNVEDNKSSVDYVYTKGIAPPDGRWLPGRGRRVFPDKKTPNDVLRNRAMLKIHTAPNIKVYLKALDVDDATYEQFDVNPKVIDIDRRGNDNKDKTWLKTGQFYVGDQAKGAVAEMTMNQNGDASITFETTMQPGDNFRVALAFDKKDLQDPNTLQVDYPDRISFVDGASDQQPKGFPGVVSPMLTVWRKLHVEVDTLAQIPTQGPQKNYVIGFIVSSGLNANGSFILNLSVPLPGGYNRFENGKIFIDGWRYKVLNSYQSNTNGVVMVKDDADGHLAALKLAERVNNQAFQLFDDDDDYLPNDFKLPLVSPAMLVTDMVKAKYVPAYIELTTDVENPTPVVPFILNQDAPYPEARGKDVPDSQGYWAYRLIAAYQPLPLNTDIDPYQSEQATHGLTLKGDSLVYLEVIRDDRISALTDLRQKAIDEAVRLMKIRRDGIVAHELGHGSGLRGTFTNQMGVVSFGDDIDHSEGGLMTSGLDQGDDVTFSPKTVLRFRSTDKWDKKR